MSYRSNGPTRRAHGPSQRRRVLVGYRIASAYLVHCFLRELLLSLPVLGPAVLTLFVPPGLPAHGDEAVVAVQRGGR